MSGTVIFPLAQWLEGTNQNSTPANDNALRIQAAFGPAIDMASAAPSSPADYDQHVIGSAWGGFTPGNIVINLGGTWKEFAAYTGMMKVIAGALNIKTGGAWAPSTTISDATLAALAALTTAADEMIYSTGADAFAMTALTAAARTLLALTTADAMRDSIVYVAPPAGDDPAATGVAGQQAYDENYHYVCVATNTWKRTPLDTWMAGS